MYTSREEQGHLLQQVLSASDMDADEERIPGEGPRPVSFLIKKYVNQIIISYIILFYLNYYYFRLYVKLET